MFRVVTAQAFESVGTISGTFELSTTDPALTFLCQDAHQPEGSEGRDDLHCERRHCQEDPVRLPFQSIRQNDSLRPELRRGAKDA